MGHTWRKEVTGGQVLCGYLVPSYFLLMIGIPFYHEMKNILHHRLPLSWLLKSVGPVDHGLNSEIVNLHVSVRCMVTDVQRSE